MSEIGALRVLYFGSLRERLGRGEDRVSPPSSVLTIGDLAAWLGERDAIFASALAADGAVRAARDQECCAWGAALGEASEIAFFPPTTGG